MLGCSNHSMKICQVSLSVDTLSTGPLSLYNRAILKRKGPLYGLCYVLAVLLFDFCLVQMCYDYCNYSEGHNIICTEHYPFNEEFLLARIFGGWKPQLTFVIGKNVDLFLIRYWIKHNLLRQIRCWCNAYCSRKDKIRKIANE